MGTYVYAITAADHPLNLDGIAGVGDPAAPLRTVRAKGLTAVVSDAPESLRAKRRDLLAHQGVQSRLMADGAVLPMRFGLVGGDDEQVAAVLEEQHDSYTARLEEVGGRLEYHLKVAREEDDLLREIMRESDEVRRLNDRTRRSPGAHQDKMALGELVAREVQARQERTGSELVERLAPAAERSAVAEPTKTHFLNVSFLVPRERAAAFSEAVHKEAGRRGDAYTFSLHGPLPPYSFV
ncbi:GvpL/GvpF family gas vesicle protein [Streptomyces sp. RS10V-4]|uniref:GvpL/GvpF family gas vesicle protein n=1 Tax=Streptomyces rhizoryzae TaxID=2932493 RepID=UPI002004A4F1|nr:GvpL/GvpF family gas vesicle protein [Streptomyces rhizoryzae]MCK7625856.1 GvpL/GvpF family gas vesicle protein [Streptomyces rhizoryzae]